MTTIRDDRKADPETAFRQVLQKSPTDAPALVGLGYLLRNRGDREQALTVFTDALSADSKNTAIKAEIAYLLRDLGRPQEAEAAFQRVLQEDPKHVSSLIGLGHILRQRGDIGGALGAFEAAALADPSNLTAKVDVGHALRELGRIKEAEVYFKGVLETDPNHSSALIGLAYTFRRLSKTDEAAASFRKVLDNDSEHVGALTGLGYLLRDVGDRARALAEFKQAASVDKKNATINLEIAYLLRDLGRLEEAEDAFLQVMQYDRQNVGAMLGLGQIKKLQGSRSDALTAFAAAAAAHPNNFGVKIHYAYFLRDIGRLEDAEEVFRAVLELNPKHAGALIGLGHLKADQFRLNEAHALFTQSVEAEPKNVESRIALGHLARRRGDRTSSLLYFEAALGIDHNNPNAKLECAVEYRDRGEFDLAKQIIDEVIRLNPGHMQSYLQLGHLHRRRGDRQAAALAYDTARAIQPNHIQVLLELATEMRALGKPYESEDLLKLALSQDPDHLGAIIQHIDHTMAAEGYEEALSIARRAIELHPRKIWPYLQAARASSELNNDSDAAGLLDKATAMCGPYPEITATRVQLFRQTRNFLAARQVLDAASEQVDTNFFLWSEKVILAISVGDYKTAGEALERAPINSTKDQGRVFLFRAQLAEAQRKYEDAIVAYRESVRLDPTDSWSHSEMARACMILLELDMARQHLCTSVELSASMNILRGQSLNVSQHHLGQILDEFLLDSDLVRQLKEARTLPLGNQIAAFQQLVRNYPDSTVPALLLVIAMRQAAIFSNRPAETSSIAPIPKRIFQFWDAADPPHDISNLISGWRDRHPNFEHALFNDQSAKEFIQRNFPMDVLHAFMRARHPAQRADIFRLAYLSVNGGFYADADDRSLAAIETFVPPNAGLMVYQENYGTLGNNFMGASPKHPVIIRALALATEAMNRGDNEILWLSTGPGLLTRAFAQIVSGVQSTASWNDGTVVRELGEMQQVIGFHCPVHYKRTEKHWSRAATRKK